MGAVKSAHLTVPSVGETLNMQRSRRAPAQEETAGYYAAGLRAHHSLYNGGIPQCLIRVVLVCVRRVRSS